jgi:hypothetical protein
MISMTELDNFYGVGGGCEMDNVDAPCGLTYATVQSGSGVVCPQCNPGQRVSVQVGQGMNPNFYQLQYNPPTSTVDANGNIYYQTGGWGFGAFPGAGAAAGTLVCEVLEPCGVVEDTLIVGGLVIEGGIWAYLHYSKGGKQNVAHDYVRDMARGMGGDYCSALKTIMDNARKAGDSKLFNDAKQTWKQDCRGQ